MVTALLIIPLPGPFSAGGLIDRRWSGVCRSSLWLRAGAELLGHPVRGLRAVGVEAVVRNMIAVRDDEKLRLAAGFRGEPLRVFRPAPRRQVEARGDNEEGTLDPLSDTLKRELERLGTRLICIRAVAAPDVGVGVRSGSRSQSTPQLYGPQFAIQALMRLSKAALRGA